MISGKLLLTSFIISGVCSAPAFCSDQIEEKSNDTDSIGVESAAGDTDSPDSAAAVVESDDNSSTDSNLPDSSFIAAASDSSWWYRKLENRSFGVGEHLVFNVKYGMLPAGTAVMKIPEIIEYQGRQSFRIVSTAKSNDVVSVFYKVRDSVETVVDFDGIFPRRFHKKLREGGYKADKTTIFDQRMHLAITEDDSIPTYAFVQDALSSLYYIRTQELVPGTDILVDNHTDKKNYPLKVVVYRRETVKVPAGKFDCVVVEPIMRAEGIFKAKGRVWIWLTDDQHKMPVKMKTEVFFLGAVHAHLKNYTLGMIEESDE
jgi:hypothetical protein